VPPYFRELAPRPEGALANQSQSSRPRAGSRSRRCLQTPQACGSVAPVQVWLVSRCAHALAELPAQAWRGSPEAPLDAAGGAWQACVFGALDLLALLLCRTPHATLRALQAEVSCEVGDTEQIG
jgi:hypothetical protein